MMQFLTLVFPLILSLHLIYYLWSKIKVLKELFPQNGYVLPTLSHANSYIFYEVANSYDLTHTILYDFSKPQWWVGLGAALGAYVFYELAIRMNMPTHKILTI